MPCSARGVSGGYFSRRSSSPCTRTVGGVPAVRWRSDPSASRSSPSSSGIGTWRSSSEVLPCSCSLHHPCDLFQWTSGPSGPSPDRRPGASSSPARYADSLDGIGRCTLHREPFDLFGHRHDLVQADPAAVAGVRARGAADRAGRARGSPATASPGSRRRCSSCSLGRVGLLAPLAQHAGEPLGDHAVDRGGHQEGLDLHLDQPRDGAIGASFVCSEDRTRWPVSAASIAIVAVSLSRISPISTMSGSARRIDRRAEANVSPAFGLTCIWFTPASRYSTGSSTVMMLLVDPG